MEEQWRRREARKGAWRHGAEQTGQERAPEKVERAWAAMQGKWKEWEHSAVNTAELPP